LDNSTVSDAAEVTATAEPDAPTPVEPEADGPLIDIADTVEDFTVYYTPEPRRWRTVLEELPLVATRLVIQEHGTITGVPLYNRLPKMEYDLKDRWTVGHKEVDDKAVIMLTLERDLISYEDAVSERKKAESQLAHNEALVRSYDRQIAAVMNAPAEVASLQGKRLGLLAEAEEIKERIAMYSERSEQKDVTVWEFPIADF
jgi:hypothetical protein